MDSANLVVGSSPTGLMEVALTPGPHDFEMQFNLGAPERYGVILTLGSVFIGFAKLSHWVWCTWARRLTAAGQRAVRQLEVADRA